MSVILWLNIVGNRKISRCRSIERALFCRQRDEIRGVPQSVPFISPTPILELWSVSHPIPTARRIFSAVGQTPRQPRGQVGAQKKAWVRGWHIARLGRYGREIIWKCHASYPSDTELFFYAAIKFKIFYNKRIYLTTSTKDSYKRSKGADICSRKDGRVIKLGGATKRAPKARVPYRTPPELSFSALWEVILQNSEDYKMSYRMHNAFQDFMP